MNANDLVLILALAFQYDTRPPAGDADRFPSNEACWKAYRLRAVHRAWVQERYFASGYKNEYACWISEIEKLGNCWELVWRCHGSLRENGDDQDHCTESWKRDRLKELRDMLGEDAYYNGWMPPMIPIWRFTEKP